MSEKDQSQKFDITYECQKCEDVFTREELRAQIDLTDDNLGLGDFVKDDIGASVEIGTHQNCGGRVRAIARHSFEGPISNQP